MDRKGVKRDFLGMIFIPRREKGKLWSSDSSHESSSVFPSHRLFRAGCSSVIPLCGLADRHFLLPYASQDRYCNFVTWLFIVIKNSTKALTELHTIILHTNLGGLAFILLYYSRQANVSGLEPPWVNNQEKEYDRQQYNQCRQEYEREKDQAESEGRALIGDELSCHEICHGSHRWLWFVVFRVCSCGVSSTAFKEGLSE